MVARVPGLMADPSCSATTSVELRQQRKREWRRRVRGRERRGQRGGQGSATNERYTTSADTSKRFYIPHTGRDHMSRAQQMKPNTRRSGTSVMTLGDDAPTHCSRS